MLSVFVPVERPRRFQQRFPLLLEGQLRLIFLLSFELSCRYAFANSGLLLELIELFLQSLVLGLDRLSLGRSVLELLS